MACSQADEDQLETLFAPPPTYEAHANTPFRCLRFIDAEQLDAGDGSLTVVDIRTGRDIDAARGSHLRLPLYEIKSKSFLHGKSIGIVSDGKRYAAIERECSDMRAAGIESVVAVLPTAADPGPAPIPISPREFVAERGAGVWHIVNASSLDTLENPVFRDAAIAVTSRTTAGSRGGRGLERTLLVFDDADAAALTQGEVARGVNGAAFVLDGGLEAFRQFVSESAAMALARARPRISERGCRS